MSSKVDNKSLEKRLTLVKDTSEDIQALSRWCIQNKNHHHSIVQAWSRAVRKAKLHHRLTLFYVCNDIVQNAKRKKYIDLVQYFGTAVKEASPLVRDEKIRRKILRIFTIWEERGIYDSKLIGEMKEIIENIGTVNATENDIVLSSFQLVKLIEGLRNLIAFEKTSQCLLLDLKTQETALTDGEISKLQNTVKERGASRERLEDFEESVLSLECYITALQKEIEERTSVVTMLEQAEIFYETQRGEAKLVANAYKNFSNLVKALKNKLTDHLGQLPDSTSPIPTPSPDAPSPIESDSEDIALLNPKDTNFNSFMDSNPMNSMAQEAIKDYGMKNSHRSSKATLIVDAMEGPNKPQEYAYRDSYSRSYEVKGRRRSSSSRDSELKKEQKDFDEQLSNITKASFKDHPKPMSAQELLDTFGNAYLNEKVTPASTNIVPFPHPHHTPAPPINMLFPPPTVGPSKPPTPLNSLSIPLPPAPPPQVGTYPPTFPHPIYSPALPPTSGNTSSSSSSWSGEPVWNPRPPPPPPPPLPERGPPFVGLPGDWHEFDSYEDPSELNEDETDNRNWGEVPGMEELEALSGEPLPSPAAKGAFFPPTMPPPHSASRPAPAPNERRLAHLVNITPHRNSAVGRPDYHCYNYSALSQEMKPEAVGEGRPKKVKGKLNHDSGSDMDISDSDSTEGQDRKGRSKKSRKVSQDGPPDGSVNAITRACTIIPLTGENKKALETANTSVEEAAMSDSKPNAAGNSSKSENTPEVDTEAISQVLKSFKELPPSTSLSLTEAVGGLMQSKEEESNSRDTQPSSDEPACDFEPPDSRRFYDRPRPRPYHVQEDEDSDVAFERGYSDYKPSLPYESNLPPRDKWDRGMDMRPPYPNRGFHRGPSRFRGYRGPPFPSRGNHPPHSGRGFMGRDIGGGFEYVRERGRGPRRPPLIRTPWW